MPAHTFCHSWRGRWAAVGAASALAATTVIWLPAAASVAAPAAQPHPVAPTVDQHPLDGVDPAAVAALGGAGGLSALSADDGHGHEQASATTVALTPQTPAKPFTVVAASWDDPAAGATTNVHIRVREKGAWTDWYDLAPETQDAPDDGTAEAAGDRGGSAPLLTNGADAYQVKVDSATGTAPAGLRVDTIDAGTSAADASLGTGSLSPQLSAQSAASATIAQPQIISRAQWGADESLRTGSPTYMSQIKVGVVHHTESTNDYDAAGAAAQMRGIYAFHTRVRGWSDVGYNFLVDKYGRIYEGRAGGVDRAVMGAHAGGYNSDTFGASVIGSHMQTQPSVAVLRALTRLFAWKYATNNIDPYGSSLLTSAGGGTARFPAGDTRAFGNLLGHRDTGSTDCPGDALYARLPSLRASVQDAMLAAGAVPGTTSIGNVLRSGATLNESQYLRSPNGQHLLAANGYAGEQYGIVLSGLSCRPIVLNKLGRPDDGTWTTTLSMQGDGNLVLYADGRAAWSSGTQNNPGAYAAIQNDRNVVVYSKAGKPLWWSGYGCNTAAGAIDRGSELRAGQTMSTGAYKFAMQSDGNLVLYVGNRPIWQAGTGGNAGAKAAVQSDGNMVVYSSAGRPLWWSGSSGSYLIVRLAVQPDGNTVVYQGDSEGSLRPTWHSGTGGVR